MEVKELAEFYRLQGHTVRRTESCFWYDASKLFYQAIPYHLPVSPSKKELQEVFFGGPAIGVRYFANTGTEGKESHIWMLYDRQYDLSSLNQKARNQTRRGMENCQVKKVGFDYLEGHGLPLVRDTLLRQGRDLRTIGEKHWKILCKVSAEQPDFEAWGAFIDNRLAAFLIAGLVDCCYYIFHQYSDSSLLRKHPNNALIFAVSRLALADSRVDCVSYGIQSLDAEHTQGLDGFKSGMGYLKEPVTQCVRFNPLARPAFGRLTYRLVKGIQAIMPESDFIRKLNGILRNHVEAGPVKEFEKP